MRADPRWPQGDEPPRANGDPVELPEPFSELRLGWILAVLLLVGAVGVGILIGRWLAERHG